MKNHKDSVRLIGRHRTREGPIRILPLVLVILILVSMCLQMYEYRTVEAKSVQQLTCELEEHTHTDACEGYVCDYPYSNHEHDSNCYQLTCELGHEHSGNCYKDAYLAEDSCEYFWYNPPDSGHVHTEDCFRYLNCDLNHEHTRECYVYLELICTKDEHVHDESCYELICKQHVHTDECIGFTCDKTEHTHSDECYTSVEIPTVETVTPSNTVINLFDYWTADSRDAVDVGVDYANGGINQDHLFKFRYLDIDSPEGRLNMNKMGGGSESRGKEATQGIVKNKLVNGYPVIDGEAQLTDYTGELLHKTDSDLSLDYLFNEYDYTTNGDNQVSGKKAYLNATDFLQLDSQGYFYYDSKSNFAEFDENTNAFTVYNRKAIMSAPDNNNAAGASGDGEYFPFNQMGEVMADDFYSNSSTLNHYFGMTLETGFLQTTPASGEDLVFNFSGDDDVWVFVDGVLVGDVGGIHSAVSLSINFSTGNVVVKGATETKETTIAKCFKDAKVYNQYQWQSSNGIATVAEGDVLAYDDSNIFAENTTHTLSFFYLERGNWDSNLKLSYNLTMVPETAIKKVDQYGNSVAGATFATYATEPDDVTDASTYYYTATDGTHIPVSQISKSDIDVDVETGTITILSGTYKGKKIEATYVGTTGTDGNMTFKSPSNGHIYAIDQLKEVLGEAFILREIFVPDGYRSSVDEACLYFDGEYLQNTDPYSDGIWPSNNALVTASNTLTLIDSSAEEGYSQVQYFDPTSISDGSDENGEEVEENTGINGTLFAVVLKRNGASLDLSSKDPLSGWYPVYGDDDQGYTVATTNDTSTILNYAIAAQDYGNVVFSKTIAGMQLDLRNLPGKITRYLTYMLQNNSDEIEENDGGLEPQYAVAYYWTNASTLEDARDHPETYSVYRVVSHSGMIKLDSTSTVDEVDESDDIDTSEDTFIEFSVNNFYPFSIKWGSTLEVPNFINRLYVQKRDTEGNPVNGASFALYEVDPETTTTTDPDSGEVTSTETVWYIASSSDETNKTDYYIKLIDSGDVDNKGKAVVRGDETIPYYYTIGTNGVISISTTEDGSAVYFINPIEDGEGDTVIQTKDHPLLEGDQNVDEVYSGVYSTGINYFTHIPDGYYVLREVNVPSGFILNTTEMKVIVSENGVFANAGTSDDYVDVGNGVGYLTKTMDVFASSGSIDETLTWVYETQRVNLAQTFDAFSLNNAKIYTSSSTHVNAGYGTGTTDSLSNAMVSYLVFDRESVNSLYDYRPSLVKTARSPKGDFEYSNKSYKFPSDVTSTALGEGTLCLYTDEGWTALEVYQDYGLGTILTDPTTNYDNLQGRDISNLYSNSVFALYTDKVMADLVIVKTDENGDALQGASFVLTDGSGNYYTEDGFQSFSEAEIQAQITAKNGAAIITSDEDGVLRFKDLVEDERYTLKEVIVPDGYTSIDSQIVEVGPYVSAIGGVEYLKVSDYDAVQIEKGDDYYDEDSSNFQYQIDVKNLKESKMDLTLFKTDINGDPISGVGFVLYKKDASGNHYYQLSENENDGTTSVSWIDNEGSAVVQTDDSGHIIFKDLDSGKYYLKEISTLDGYVLDSEEKTISIGLNTAGTSGMVKSVEGKNLTLDQDGVTLTMVNRFNTQLPTLGGFGTWMLILAAVILIIIGVSIRKKKNNTQDKENS